MIHTQSVGQHPRTDLQHRDKAAQAELELAACQRVVGRCFAASSNELKVFAAAFVSCLLPLQVFLIIIIEAQIELKTFCQHPLKSP